MQKPVIALLNEEATARKVPTWLDPEIPESQFPVDTEKLRERLSLNKDHKGFINLHHHIFLGFFFLPGFCGTASGKVRLLCHCILYCIHDNAAAIPNVKGLTRSL